MDASSVNKLLQRSRLLVTEDGRVLRDGAEAPTSDNGYGYLKVRAGHFTFKVHKVAAEQFFGGVDPCLFPRISKMFSASQWDVAHKDHDKKNNTRSNLMIAPHAFNMVHSSPCPLIYRLECRRRYLEQSAKARLEKAMANGCGRSWCKAAFRFNIMASKRRLPKPDRSRLRPSAKLSEAQVALLLELAPNNTKRGLGRRFGISATQVHRIVSGQDWRAR